MFIYAELYGDNSVSVFCFEIHLTMGFASPPYLLLEQELSSFPGRFSLVLQHEAEHQLKSIAIPRDSLIRIEQLIINYTLLIPPNTQKKLRTMVIWFCGRCWCMAPRFSTLWIIVVYPLFIATHDKVQKTFPFLPLNQQFTRDKTPFDVSRLQFIRHPMS